MTYTTTMKQALTMYNGMPLDELYDTMYSQTDENGVLYLPVGQSDVDDRLWRCEMTWTAQDIDSLKRNFDVLYEHLQQIARVWDPFADEPVDMEAHFGKDNAVYRTFCTYIRPFDSGDFDVELINDIDETLDMLELCAQLERLDARGETLTDSEREFYMNAYHLEVEPEEEEMVHAYFEYLDAQAQDRIGSGFQAYETVVRAMRLCRLFCHDASREIHCAEARKLMFAMAMHRFAVAVDMTISDKDTDPLFS